MRSIEKAFNKSKFSSFLNSRPGRIFRIAAGSVFLIIGILFKNYAIGIFSIVWSVFPLSAGTFDVCYISALFGGPFSGKKIRSLYNSK